MSEVKSRSIRLDDENWEWLSSLPGRSANEAVGALRATRATRATREVTPMVGSGRFHEFKSDDRMDEVLEFVRSAPSEMELACLRALEQLNAKKPPADWTQGRNTIERTQMLLDTPQVARHPVRLGLEPSSSIPANSSESGLMPCRHCGLDGQISPRTNIWRGCGACQKDGHVNFSDCRRCLELERAKKLASSPTGVDDPSVSYDFKEPA